MSDRHRQLLEDAIRAVKTQVAVGRFRLDLCHERDHDEGMRAQDIAMLQHRLDEDEALLASLRVRLEALDTPRPAARSDPAAARQQAAAAIFR